MAVTGKRPFWLHQVAEYVLAAGLVTAGVRGADPLVPVALGIALALNTMVVDGPLGAFQAVGRRAHRVLDIVLLVAMVAALVAPGVGSKWVIAGVALVQAFVILNSNYLRRADRRPVQISEGGGRSEEVGRLAGRAAGLGVQAYRRRRPGR